MAERPIGIPEWKDSVSTRSQRGREEYSGTPRVHQLGAFVLLLTRSLAKDRNLLARTMIRPLLMLTR